MFILKETGERLNHRQAQNQLGISFPRDNPPPGLTIITPAPPPEPTPDELKQRQGDSVRRDANTVHEAPVTDAAGVAWNGGFDSALKIKSAADMAEFAGLADITLYDLNNDPHTVTLPEAKVVAATIGAAYQQQLGAKQAALRALRDIDPDAPDAKSQIEAVSFSGFHSTKG